jgi:hypothetical protein
MTEQDQRTPEEIRKNKVVRAVMFGLMAGSGLFLALRMALKLDVEISLIAATFSAFSVAVFLLHKIATG